MGSSSEVPDYRETCGQLWDQVGQTRARCPVVGNEPPKRVWGSGEEQVRLQAGFQAFPVGITFCGVAALPQAGLEIREALV